MAKSAAKIAAAAPINAGKRFANEVVTLEAAAPASRLNLRATKAGATAFEKKLGFKLPQKPGETSSKTGKTALWLGPDEWLIIDEKNPSQSMVPDGASKTFSAVDISQRNTAFIISGPGAANTLNAACPRDLSLEAFPKGSCSRTIFGKAEVVLYRSEAETFRLECWRSFAPYVWTYLLEAARDAHV